MKKHLILLSLLIFGQINNTLAQQFVMQGWYWDYPKTAGGNSWADTLRLKTSQLSNAGFTHIWIPPHTISASGQWSNGYDPKDLFIGNQTSGLGTRAALNSMLATFASNNIEAVGDMIYNHRDGGEPEDNPAVKAYITQHYTAAKAPFPSDRYQCVLPLGGSSGNGAGDYYFKISSKSGDLRFQNYGYNVYMYTNAVGWQSLADQQETEPNGGSDCGQSNNNIQLGRNMLAGLEITGCAVDEFKLTISNGDFNPAGDAIFIKLNNTGGYSDHRIYSIWSSTRNADIVQELYYQTYTNFNYMPSGRGQMNYDFFKPNNSNAASQYLSGDWDAMYFYYDYDQYQAKTRDSLYAWTQWNYDALGITGLRLDAIKHFSPEFVGDLLDNMHNAGKNPSFVVGEWYGTNTTELKNWVNDVKFHMNTSTQAAIQPKVFDFSLRENLRQACDNPFYDVRNIFQSSVHDAEGLSGFHIATFVNNHDFRDGSGFASLVRNRTNLAYAYILTNNQIGTPVVYYPDYYGYEAATGQYGFHPQGLPAFKDEINDIIAVHKLYIKNSPYKTYLNNFGSPFSSSFIAGNQDKVLIYQLAGSASNNNRDVIVAINFGGTTLRVDQQINTNLGSILPGTIFNDVLGRSSFPMQVVSSNSAVYIELPPYSYLVWVQGFSNPLTIDDNLTFAATPQGNHASIKWQLEPQDLALVQLYKYSPDGKTKTLLLSSNDGNINSYQDYEVKPFETYYYQLAYTLNGQGQRKTTVIPVAFTASQLELLLSQNPITQNLNFTAQSDRLQLVDFNVIDANGKTIVSVQKHLAAGLNNISIGTEYLPAGHYLLSTNTMLQGQKLRFTKL
jgi:hypothetical protein